MLSICFEDKVINFTAECPPGLNAETKLCEEDFDIAKVLQKLENNKSLWVVSEDFLLLFERFCALFVPAEAAGGVVANGKGEVLMIRRKGRWDLPKGHREPGESWEECALREVEEECGITGIECGGLITATWHSYELGGQQILKHCRWFAMRYAGSEKLVPQLEEGIEQAGWFARKELTKALVTSYITIKNVFDTYNR